MRNQQAIKVTRCLATVILLLTQAACTVPEASMAQSGCSDETGVVTSPLLTVLTLNVAHGRKDAFNQMMQKTATTRRNLAEIAAFLAESDADVIGLQEADAASRWSGKFDHVDFIAEKSAYPCRIHGVQATGYMYNFGTALLSKVAFTESLEHTFAPSPPTTSKGFVMGRVAWNPGGQLAEPVEVGVISVHLDFSRKSVRKSQIEEMRNLLRDTGGPMVIMGDFNADWNTDGSAIKEIATANGFRVFEPEAAGLGTYKSGKTRLDWILVSEDLEFVSYEVPGVVISDHMPVLATLKLAGPTDAGAAGGTQ